MKTILITHLLLAHIKHMDSKKVLPVVYAIIHMERRMIFLNLKKGALFNFKNIYISQLIFLIG